MASLSMGSGVIVYLISHDILRSIVGLVSAVVLSGLIKYYLKKNENKNKIFLSAIVFGIIGSIYMFTPYKTLKNILHLGFELRHNDYVYVFRIK